MTPKGTAVEVSKEGVENTFAVNYLANFHLLSILSPAIRAQPPDRDVRVLFATCSSYMGGQIPEQVPRPTIAKVPKKGTKSTKDQIPATSSHAASYATSKLCLMTFATAFQKHLSSFTRPDKQPNNARIMMIDPGWCRTPGMRRFLTRGSLVGLVIYILTWPLWWLILKSSEQGAQSFLYAAMDAEFERSEGGQLIKEVIETKLYREEIKDEKAQQKLWQLSEKAIEALEKEGAQKRANEKAETAESAKVEEKQKAGQPEKKEGSRRSKQIAKPG